MGLLHGRQKEFNHRLLWVPTQLVWVQKQLPWLLHGRQKEFNHLLSVRAKLVSMRAEAVILAATRAAAGFLAGTLACSTTCWGCESSQFVSVRKYPFWLLNM